MAAARILVVDDHAESAEVLAQLLRQAGHHVTVALSLADASFGGVSLGALPLQGIPFKVSVQTLDVASSGLVIGLAGSNLVYHS